MASRQQEFVERVYAAARAAGLDDIEARTAAAQAALETGYGRSMPGGNMFGIKSGPSWQGPSHVAQTWEVENGQVRTQPASFRSYEDPMDSLADWQDVTSSRWPGVFEAETFRDATRSLNAGRRGGYATDPNYAGKLSYIDSRFNDLKNYAAAIPTGIPDVTPQSRPNPQSMPESILSAAAQPASFAPLDYNAEANGFANSLLAAYAPMEAPATVANQPVQAPDPFMDVSISRNAFERDPQPLADAPVMAATAPMMAAPAGAAAFDMDRFGPQLNMPTLPSLAQANIVGQPSIAGMTGVRGPDFAKAPTSLLDTANLAAFPLERTAAAMPAPVDVPAPPPVADLGPVPNYTDPMVVNAANMQGPVAAPASAPQAAHPSTPMVSVGVDGITMDAATRDAAANSSRLASLLDDVQGTRMRNAAIGGILGTIVGGPLGGILGLGLASRFTNGSPQAQSLGYFPSAPSLMGWLSQAIGRGDYSDVNGYSSLSAEGRDIYDSSSQVRDAVDAVDSGKSQGGLW